MDRAMLHVIAVALVMAVGVCQGLRAAEAEVRVPDGQVLMDSEQSDLHMEGRAAADTRVERVSVSGPSFRRAYRVTVTAQPRETYEMQLVHRLAAPLPRGHVVMYTGYVRTLATQDETAEGRVGAVIEQSGEPYAKEVQQVVTARGTWTPFYLPFQVRHDHRQTGTQLTLRVGFAPQTVEIGGVRLIDYGPEGSLRDLPRTRLMYDGAEATAPWRKVSEQRIEQHRKGDLTVEVVDASGQPVPNAAVNVQMRKHAFEFGSVYNPSRITGARADDPDSEIYRQKFVESFDVAVDEWAMKWPAWDHPGNRQLGLDSLAWVREQGLRVRGHTMIWPSWRRTPESIRALAEDPTALRQRVATHILEIGRAYAGHVIDWDVVNEPYSHYDILEILGRDVMAEWFKLAREADPHAVLYLNEAGQPNSPPRSERYDVLEQDLQMLIEHGAPVGGIGMQGHFGQHLISPDELLSIYDRFAAFGLPIKITELDIDHPDDEIQAAYMRDFLTASFSHPSIEGILLWGFWEGQHWRPQAALWRKDWSMRPVGEVWFDMTRNRWWTRAQGNTDSDGRFVTRGFLGEYEVTATAAGRSASRPAILDRDGATVRLVLE